MTTLFNGTITTAATVTSLVFKYAKRNITRQVSCQANLTYGSGGTTVNVYLQTSLDQGASWCDVISFTQMTTSNSRQIASTSSVSGSSATNVMGVLPSSATDGTLAAGTMVPVFGDLWRVKVISTGTYAGGTTLQVDVQTEQIMLSGAGQP